MYHCHDHLGLFQAGSLGTACIYKHAAGRIEGLGDTTKSLTVQNPFQPVPGLKNYTEITGRWGLHINVLCTVEPLYNGHHWEQKVCPL